MSPRVWITGLICSCVLMPFDARISAAAPRIPAPKRPPVAPYVARMQEYSVVVPADPHAAEHDHAVWQQQRPKAPLYPWGWFGACSHWQRGTHLRYYGETVDFSVRRGY